MKPLVDDVGSFPLPSHVRRGDFEQAYKLARKLLIEGKSLKEDKFVFQNFYRIVVDSFAAKLESGLDVATYPQHYDMHKQFTDVIHKAMDEGTYLIDADEAIIPEVRVIEAEAENLNERFGSPVALRVCITGPMELYLAMVGTVVYRDVLMMFAETVRRFAENSILNSKNVKTAVVSLDEPSFGFRDLSADRETIIEVLEKALNFKGPVKQIHVHTPVRILELLEVENLDVISIESAATPRYMDQVSKGMLEKADKNIRVGITRTDINNIIAELYGNGITSPQAEQLIEDEETIIRRFKKALEKFEERLSFVGPDCGLGGWPTQEAAKLLLQRTTRAVKRALSIPDAHL